MMEKFGFGDYTGIDIYEESDGILPSAQWKRARYNQPWYGGETLSVGIGQSYWLVTPLQLAHATSILVNRGEIKVPHLVNSIHQPIPKDKLNINGENLDKESTDETELNTSVNNESLLDFSPKPPIELKNPKNWQYVLDGLHNTVQKFGATAHNAFKGSNYDAAGKTGSAQVASLGEDEEYDASKVQENQRDNAMFIAFAPFDNPEIVVAVAIENVAKGGGATNAAPVARQVMDQYFGDRFAQNEIGHMVLPIAQHNHQNIHQHYINEPAIGQP